MIGDKSSALSSEIRIFFRNPQSRNDSESPTPQANKRQQGKQNSQQAPLKMQVSPQKAVAYTPMECSKDTEMFGEEEQLIDQFQDYTQIQSEYEQLKRWFEGLTVAERVNCLTTTYPSLVSKLIEAHFEMRDNGILSLFKRHTSAQSSIYAMQSQSSYSQGLYGLGINISAQNQYKQQMQAMYARYDSKIQQHTGYGQKPSHQSSSKQGQGQTIVEFPILELVKSEEVQIRNLGSQNMRAMQEEFLHNIRITDYQQQFDTLTVSPQLVTDPSKFFSLVAEITNHKAFREPAIFKQKGGRVKIDSPSWAKKLEYNYLSVWIIVVLEESLWAHFNFANKVNIDRNVRQDTLNNMFKERTESHFSQEDLAKRWQEIGHLGRKRLIEKLKQKAKETLEVYQGTEAQHGLDEVHVMTDDYNCTAMQGFNGYQTEDLVNSFSQNQRNYQNQSPYSQFYTFHKIPLRSSFTRTYNELFLSDPESAFARIQNHDRDLQEILDFVQTDWGHITPLDVIKFLSETPIEEMESSHRARKHFLCRELNSLIQEDLRQSIQNQLMNEDLFVGKQKGNSVQAQVSSQHLNSTAIQGNNKKQKLSSNPSFGSKLKDSKESPENDQRNQSPVVKAASRKKKTKNKNKQSQNADTDKHSKLEDQNTAEESGDLKGAQEPDPLQKCKSEVVESLSTDVVIEASDDILESQDQSVADQTLVVTDQQQFMVTIDIPVNQELTKESESKQQKGQRPRNKRKGKPNTLNATATSQPGDLLTIGKVSKQENCKQIIDRKKDWLQRQTNSSSKRKTSQRSPTFSSQICEVTGSSTHSFDDDKFCPGTGPSSGGGIFSDDNITQNEGEHGKRAKQPKSPHEILLLDCTETETKSNKTANLLTKIRSDRQTSSGVKEKKSDKTTKRADSGNDKADWSGVGSGLIIKSKGNSRESEPQQTLKQQLDFKNIFGEANTEVKKPMQASTDYQSSQKTRQSTISDKTKSKPSEKVAVIKPAARSDKKLMEPSEQPSDSSSLYANLNVLSASQSVDFLTKKPAIQDTKSTKSSHAIVTQPDKSNQIKDPAGQATKRKNSGRKKRNSQSRSSSDSKEENLLIRHFVTQLIDQACDIVMQDKKDLEQSDKASDANAQHEDHFADALEERKAPEEPIAEILEEVVQKKQSKRPKRETREEKPEKGPVEQIKEKAVKDQTTKAATSDHKAPLKSEQTETWRQPTKPKPTTPVDSEQTEQGEAKKKKRQRNKKKNDNEIALNNFMRQVAGDRLPDQASKQVGGKNDRNERGKPKQPAKNEKADKQHQEEGKKKHETKRDEVTKIAADSLRLDDHEKGPGKKRRSRHGSTHSKQEDEQATIQPSPTIETNTTAEQTPVIMDKQSLAEKNSTTTIKLDEVKLEEISVNQITQQQSIDSGSSYTPSSIEKIQFQPEMQAEQPEKELKDEFMQDHLAFGGFKSQYSESYNDFGEDRRRPYGTRFDPMKNGKSMPKFQKFNSGPNHMNKWNDKRREPFDADYNEKKQFGQWQGNSFNQNRTYHHGQYQHRHGYGFQGQQRYYDYNKVNNQYEDVNEYPANYDNQQTPPIYAQSFSPNQDQGFDNWSRGSQPRDTRGSQDEAIDVPLRQASGVSDQASAQISVIVEQPNPFGEKSTRQSFTPQANPPLLNTQFDTQQINNSVNSNRVAQQWSHDQAVKINEFKAEELQKQYSAENSKASVWSHQSNPFRPNEQQQKTWSETGPSSPFNPARQSVQFADSHINSPVNTQPNFIKVQRNTLPAFNENMAIKIDNRQYLKQQSFQPRIPQFERLTADFQDQRQMPTMQAYPSYYSANVYPHAQQSPFDQFGFAFNNQRVGSYQVSYQSSPLIMQFLEGVGDPMSMFNYADPEQKTMQADPTYQQIEDQFYKDFDTSIQHYIRKITVQVDKYKKERENVLQKIQTIANKVYINQNPQIKMFGSLITGLALETSDMDLVVQGLSISDRQVMIYEMHSLAEGLRQWDLVEDLKPIDTAAIPVIKAKINLKLLRSRESGEPMSDSEANENDWLPIDITFDDSPSQSSNSPTSQDCNFKFGANQFSQPFGAQPFMAGNFGIEGFQNFKFGFQANPFGADTLPEEQNYVPPMYMQNQKTHLGLASCTLIKDYIQAYPHLRDVAVLLKTFLSSRDLNSSYHGGISSYSAVLLIVAYMNYYNLQTNPKITPSRLLMGFLDFYSNCFDAAKYGVKTINQMSYYPLTSMNQPMFVIIDPVNPSNNTAKNSFRTPDVLKSFRDAFRRLKSLIYSRYQKTLSSADKVGLKALASETHEAVAEAKDGMEGKRLSEICGKDSAQIAAQLKEADDQRQASVTKDDMTDSSKVFSSVDFVQTFLSSEQADQK